MFRRPCLLPILLLLLAACGKPAEPPPTAPATLAAPAAEIAPDPACRWAITLEDDGAARVEPDPGMGMATVVWQGALNEDEGEDLLLRFPEGCGNYGECPYALYVACAHSQGGGDGHYREVWGPDYAMDVQMGKIGDDGWRSILRMQREGDQMHEEPLAYTDGGYRPTAPVD